MTKTVYRRRTDSATARRLMVELSQLTLEMEKKPGALMRYNEKLDEEGICMGSWLRKLAIAREVLDG